VGAMLGEGMWTIDFQPRHLTKWRLTKWRLTKWRSILILLRHQWRREKSYNLAPQDLYLRHLWQSIQKKRSSGQPQKIHPLGLYCFLTLSEILGEEQISPLADNNIASLGRYGTERMRFGILCSITAQWCNRDLRSHFLTISVGGVQQDETWAEFSSVEMATLNCRALVFCWK